MEWRFRKLSHDFALIQRQRPEKHNDSFPTKNALNGGQGPSKNRRGRVWLQLILKGWMRQLRWAYFAAKLLNLDLRTIGCGAVEVEGVNMFISYQNSIGDVSTLIFLCVCFRCLFTDSIPWELSHHFSPPFGRICVELFPTTKQAKPRMYNFGLAKNPHNLHNTIHRLISMKETQCEQQNNPKKGGVTSRRHSLKKHLLPLEHLFGS